MEALAPVLVDDLALVLHELPAGAHVVLCDPERVRTRAADLVRTSQEFLDASWAAAAGGGKAPIDLAPRRCATSTTSRDDARALGLPWWGITRADHRRPRHRRRARSSRRPTYRGDTEAAMTDLRSWTRDGWRVALVFDGHGSAQRAVERLAAAEIPARLVADADRRARRRRRHHRPPARRAGRARR